MAVIHATDQTFQQTVQQGTVLVDFWAAWCGPCQMIAPVLEELDAEIGHKVKIVKVNVDENPATASAFQVMSIPTLLLFKDGQPVAMTTGFKPKEVLKQFIEAY